MARIAGMGLTIFLVAAGAAWPGTTIVITNDTVISTTLIGDVDIGDFSSPALTNRPLVTVVAGGQITGNINIYQGTLDVQGGQVGNTLIRNYSFFNMTGGTLGPVTVLQNHYKCVLDGGTIPNKIQTSGLGNETLLLSGLLNSLDVSAGVATVRMEVASSIISGSAGKVDIEAGATTFQYYPEGTSTQHIHGALDSTKLIRLRGVAHAYFYGQDLATNFVTNGVVILNVTCEQFRITGTMQDGTVLRNVSYYVGNGTAPTVHLVETNVNVPAVAIASAVSNNVSLSWLYPPLGWTLQLSTNALPDEPTNAWKDVAAGPSIVGANKVVTLPGTNDFVKFRLISK